MGHENGAEDSVLLVQESCSSPTGDAVEPQAEPKDQWNVDWWSPFLLTCGIVLGIASGLGHHVFNQHFTHRPIEGFWTQSKAQLVGSTLAFITKTAFTSAAGVAFHQHVWYTVRRRPLTLSSIDSLFAIQGSAMEFLSFGTWTTACTCMIIAALIWCIPFSAIVTPGTLTAAIFFNTQETDISVPSLNMCDFPIPPSADGPYCLTPYPGGPEEADFNQILRQAMDLGEISAISSPCQAQNCSYTLEYLAPVLQCNETTPYPSSWWTTYISEDAGSYVRNYNGAMLSYDDPTLKIPHGPLDPNLRIPDIIGVNITIATSFLPLTYRGWTCLYRNASLSYNFRFQDSSNGPLVQATRDPVYLDINYDTETPLYLIPLVIDQFTGYQTVEANESTILASINDTTNFNISQASWVRSYLMGVGDEPQISEDLGKAMEMFSRNLTVSMMTINNATANIKATISSTYQGFSYEASTLFIAYGCSLLATLFTAAFGVASYVRNGIAGDFKFSTVLRATYHTRLGSLAGTSLGAAPMPEKLANVRLRFGELVGEGEGGRLLGRGSEIEEEQGGGGAESFTPGFGVEGEVKELTRGKKYL